MKFTFEIDDKMIEEAAERYNLPTSEVQQLIMEFLEDFSKDHWMLDDILNF
jgi:hypothetical protein